MRGKDKLVEILINQKYFKFKEYFYVTFGSYDEIDCGFLVINDKITINIIEKDGDIAIIGGDEISGGYWYDLEDMDYMKECLDKVYQALEKECA